MNGLGLPKTPCDCFVFTRTCSFDLSDCAFLYLCKNSSCYPVGFHLEHYSCSQPILLSMASLCLNSLIELNSKRRDDPQGPTQSNSFTRRLRRCCVGGEMVEEGRAVCKEAVCVRSSLVEEMDNVQVLKS